jgi:hypothetical protein
MVETKTDSRTTLITVKNWALYQGNGEQMGEQTGDQKGEQKESRLPTDKNDKNEKNEKNVERETRSSPANVEEAKAFFKRQGFVNPDVEAQKFFDYYGARGWAGVEDWQELARVWNARTLEYAKRGNGEASQPRKRKRRCPIHNIEHSETLCPKCTIPLEQTAYGG